MGGSMSTLANMTVTTRGDLLATLCEQVDAESREMLREDNPDLVIGEFNRKTVLRMLEMEGKLQGGKSPVDPSSARLLVCELRSFLDEHMPDKPEGHFWIALSCLFLSFVVDEPMHPQNVVGWERAASGAYECPVRDDADEGLCRWCVCVPIC